MKKSGIRFFVLSVAVILLSSIETSSSNALFGLSKCEQVKKEMLRLEKHLNADINFFEKRRGTVLTDSVMPRYDRIIDFSSPKKGDVYLMWKLGTNNLKCFSNTQQKAISRLETFDTSKLIRLEPVGKMGNSVRIVWLSHLKSIYLE